MPRSSSNGDRLSSSLRASSSVSTRPPASLVPPLGPPLLAETWHLMSLSSSAHVRAWSKSFFSWDCTLFRKASTSTLMPETSRLSFAASVRACSSTVDLCKGANEGASEAALGWGTWETASRARASESCRDKRSTSECRAAICRSWSSEVASARERISASRRITASAASSARCRSIAATASAADSRSASDARSLSKSAARLRSTSSASSASRRPSSARAAMRPKSRCNCPMANSSNSSAIARESARGGADWPTEKTALLDQIPT
mmetsp:Transcript_78422/g.199390  ORF Transcript_78422/g.199390 Transcript_78422/m.199390 type:complete len:264 (+) Transcript_78422:410-1201(+)